MIEYFSLTGLLIEPERHIILCASGSVVEYRLAKARVAGSNPVSRFFYCLNNIRRPVGTHRLVIFFKNASAFLLRDARHASA